MFLDFVTVGAFTVACFIVYSMGLALTRLQRPAQQLTGLGEVVPSDAMLPVGRVTARPPVSDDEAHSGQLDLELSRAGWYKPGSRERFFRLRSALVVYTSLATAVACFILALEDFELGAKVAVAGATVAVLVWALPRIYLRAVGGQRVKRIRKAIPDALDLMTMCLTGGLPLNRAFQYVSRELSSAHPDLSTEFAIVQRHGEMRSLDFAFRQFAKRIDVPEVQSLSSLVTQSQRLGTDITTAIRNYADNTRLRRRQSADERANKASVKMLFPLTLCLLPSVFMILWGPSVLELWTFLQSFQGAAAGG